MRTVIAVLIASLAGVVGMRAQESTPPATSSEQVVAKIVAREAEEVKLLQQYSPLVETYIQRAKSNPKLGWTPNGDLYFLGRAAFNGQTGLEIISPRETGRFRRMLDEINRELGITTTFQPRGFLQMIYLDPEGLSTQNYRFQYIRREFLGEVRTLVFDVIPTGKNAKGRFAGRIWADDESFAIVRFNGTFASGKKLSNTFDFDSWRVNVGPNLWLPAFVYSEVKAYKFGTGSELLYKAQMRLWGYNVGRTRQEEDLSKVLVESNAPIEDRSAQDSDLSPIQEQREWDRQAAQNVLEKLQGLGLLGAPGEVDKVLQTVANNLETTNQLDIEPEIQCRVLMTSTIESFSLGHTIILSRGLIDVLPDEATLAAMVAKEMAHIVLGHSIDPRYAFFDQLYLPEEKNTFRRFNFSRTNEDEAAASMKAAELLSNSPYKDQLATARLFIAELQSRSKQIPSLISPRLGDPALAMPPITPEFGVKPAASDIVALPLGGRIKFNPWNNELTLLKASPVSNISPSDKIPFEVTPFFLYLTRQPDADAKNSKGDK